MTSVCWWLSDKTVNMKQEAMPHPHPADDPQVILSLFWLNHFLIIFSCVPSSPLPSCLSCVTNSLLISLPTISDQVNLKMNHFPLSSCQICSVLQVKNHTYCHDSWALKTPTQEELPLFITPSIHCLPSCELNSSTKSGKLRPDCLAWETF